jgi:hypothetical protein
MAHCPSRESGASHNIFRYTGTCVDLVVSGSPDLLTTKHALAMTATLSRLV